MIGVYGFFEIRTTHTFTYIALRVCVFLSCVCISEFLTRLLVQSRIDLQNFDDFFSFLRGDSCPTRKINFQASRLDS